MKPSTNSGSSTTASAWHTWPTNPASSSSKANSTEELPPGVTTPTSGSVFTTTPSPGESDAELIAPGDVPSSSAAPEASGSPGDELDGTVQGAGSKSRSPGGCQAGYYTDARGRCKKGSRRRVSFLPFALRMLPKRLGTQRST
uniref:Fam65a protein n=1 Tax=Fopius arisanus TaxID=64838 RepID=A0A0C9RE34_9HYME